MSQRLSNSKIRESSDRPLRQIRTIEPALLCSVTRLKELRSSPARILCVEGLAEASGTDLHVCSVLCTAGVVVAQETFTFCSCGHRQRQRWCSYGSTNGQIDNRLTSFVPLSKTSFRKLFARNCGRLKDRLYLTSEEVQHESTSSPSTSVEDILEFLSETATFVRKRARPLSG